MKSEYVNTVGELIQFLMQFDPNKKIALYDYEYSQILPLQDIELKGDDVVLYP